MKEFYQMTASEAMQKVNGGVDPLSEQQIRENQKRYGENRLTEEGKKPVWRIFLEQYQDFLVLILIAAAVVSGLLGEMESAVVIFVVITVNAILGTVQTIKAEQSLDSLKEMSAPRAKVFRGKEVVKIPAHQVTVGDVVMLEAGDLVPADGRILECASLKAEESALTGESLGVEKTEEKIETEVPLADRRNMVFSGSFISYGRGSFLVTAIGMDTEIGKIASMLAHTAEKKTPLQISLDRFGRMLSVLILLFCAVLFGISLVRGESWGEAFLFATALAVAAIPEALSSIVTIVLAFGTRKMAKEHAIIRKLQAVEGLGSVSVICSDKTGTLTQNKMTVVSYYLEGRQVPADEITMENAAEKQLFVHSVLCNDATHENGQEIGDPTEIALLNLGEQKGEKVRNLRDSYPRLAELPFDSERKMMSTLHAIKGKTVLLTKGAVDVLLERTTFVQKEGGSFPVTEEDREEIKRQNQQYSQQGLRVLAFAYKWKDDKEQGAITADEEHSFVFLGMIAMMDPPRKESRQAVEACIRAGMKPVMITGDHKITAAAIAKQIGILKEETEVCEGAAIENMSEEELQEFVEHISVYARVSPEHKIRIVRAWQQKGHIVAMTGDGVNDAPALKQADIGIAMGITGTETAKHAASMVLSDDNFATIIKAVEHGRNVYQNIKHAIRFLLSGNFAGILTVLYASVAGLSVPFAPVHLLFINLLTDSLPAIALGLEPHENSVMQKPPRPAGEDILTRKMLLGIGLDGLCIGITTIASYYIGLGKGPAAASTMAFGTLCISRLLYGFHCKSEQAVLFTKKFLNNKYLNGAFLIGLGLITTVLTHPAFRNVLQVTPLGSFELAMVYILPACNLLFLELVMKWIRR
ncbi:cation-translocating P-type ATPase [Roseburia hominis]